MKRAQMLFIAVCSLLVLCPLAWQASPCFAKYSGGSGTAGDPYKIGSAADLLAMAANTGDYGTKFILTADIDLSSYNFTTAVIARDTDNSSQFFEGIAFRGVFDGAGHKITNLTINTNGAEKDHLGLFGEIKSGGQIKNLSLQNVNIIADSQSQRIGALVGENNEGNITNCFSTGTIVVAHNAWAVGGLVGIDEIGNVSHCYSTVIITGGENTSVIGGLVGSTYKGSISDCCSMGNVSVSDGYNSGGCGGLIGNNGGDIVRCYAVGNITGGNNAGVLGGLVGKNSEANIIDCFSTGNVTGGNGSYFLGGLVGENDGTDMISPDGSNIINCFSAGDVTGGYNSSVLGGLVGWNYIEANITNCFSTSYVTSRN